MFTSQKSHNQGQNHNFSENRRIFLKNGGSFPESLFQQKLTPDQVGTIQTITLAADPRVDPGQTAELSTHNKIISDQYNENSTKVHKENSIDMYQTIVDIKKNVNVLIPETPKNIVTRTKEVIAKTLGLAVGLKNTAMRPVNRIRILGKATKETLTGIFNPKVSNDDLFGHISGRVKDYQQKIKPGPGIVEKTQDLGEALYNLGPKTALEVAAATGNITLDVPKAAVGATANVVKAPPSLAALGTTVFLTIVQAPLKFALKPVKWLKKGSNWLKAKGGNMLNKVGNFFNFLKLGKKGGEPEPLTA